MSANGLYAVCPIFMSRRTSYMPLFADDAAAPERCRAEAELF